MHNLNLKKASLIFSIIVITLFIGFLYSAEAKESTDDMLELSIEELMEIDILSSNVLGTHTHLKGEWMIGYSYMYMHMGGNRSGTSDQTESDVLNDFVVAPIWMDMQMHMVMPMYGVTDDLTVMGMIPYVYKKMQHINRGGVKFDTTSHGLGDIRVETLYTLYGNVKRDKHTVKVWKPHRILLRSGISFPTGSIDKKDTTPAKVKGTLPFPMQLGSGTFDFLPGITYLGESDDWAWSLETLETVRFGHNSHKYRLGNNYFFSGRLSRKITDKSSISAKIVHNIWKNIHGRDFLVDPTSAPSVPTKRPDLRGGERTDFFIGFDFYESTKSGEFNKGNRLGLEVGFPVYQSLDGPQLKTDWQLNFAWSLTF